MQYFVKSHEPTKLGLHGEVYVPKLKVDYVIFTTDLSEDDISDIDGVYEVSECRTGTFNF